MIGTTHKTLAEERVAATLEMLADDWMTLRSNARRACRTRRSDEIGRYRNAGWVYYRLAIVCVSEDTQNLASPRGFEPLLPP